MDLDFRFIAPDEVKTFVETGERADTGHADPGYVERLSKLLDPSRCLAAYDEGRMVGTAGDFGLHLSVPGGSLPVAGVTEVGVLPTHRRRGVLTELKRRELEAIRERGEIVAALWASEGAIYGRFGYGLASYACSIRAERRLVRLARGDDPGGRLEIRPAAEARPAISRVYDGLGAVRPGAPRRDAAWWDMVVGSWDDRAEPRVPVQYVVHETDGRPDGYAAFRNHGNWTEGMAAGELQVQELVALTPEAHAALWRLLFDMDLVAIVGAWNQPIDEPLLHLVDEPRRLRLTVRDAVWVRLVDVPAALAARRYATPGALTIDLRDGFCPWNAGRYRLEVDDEGTATCERSTGDPDLAVDVADLGAAYLGGTGLTSLAGAGRVREQRPGALRRADTMFRWSPAPWCPAVF